MSAASATPVLRTVTSATGGSQASHFPPPRAHHRISRFTVSPHHHIAASALSDTEFGNDGRWRGGLGAERYDCRPLSSCPFCCGEIQAQASPTVRQGGRLIYAEPRDLPSFPSLGLRRGKDAASRAASLGWANQKGPAQPGDNAAASTAVALARNAPSVKTAQTPAAAVDEIAQRLPAALGGASAAASQAFKAHQARKSSQTTVAPATVTSTPASLDRQKSLRAAKLAGVRTGAGARPRSQSNPLSPRPSDPDEANAAALSAATLAHRPSVRHIANFGGAVPYTTMDRQMFTSHPPVQAEVDEQRRSLVIHASALAMAKRLYSQQQRVTDATKHASPEANAPRPATADSASHSGSQTAPYGSLQEAAYGLAQERLAKLHEEHRQTRGFQEYYGNPGAPQRRSAIRARLRRRASSDGAVVEDRKRSQQIRDQMSLFSTRLSRVDEQKQRRDREAVLDAAQRNVQAQLKDMDTRVYAVTGRVPPTVLDEWEQKAHAAAHARSEARKDGNAGRVDVGGGLYVDRKTVDEAAAKRVQPIIVSDTQSPLRLLLAVPESPMTMAWDQHGLL